MILLKFYDKIDDKKKIGTKNMESNKKSIFFKLKIAGALIMVVALLFALMASFLMNNILLATLFYSIFYLAPIFICIVTAIEIKKSGETKGFKSGITVSIIIYIAYVINAVLLFIYQPLFNEVSEGFAHLKGALSISQYDYYLTFVTQRVNILSGLNIAHAIIFSVSAVLFIIYVLKYVLKNRKKKEVVLSETV